MVSTDSVMPHDHARILRWDQATPILASQILPGFLKALFQQLCGWGGAALERNFANSCCRSGRGVQDEWCKVPHFDGEGAGMTILICQLSNLEVE